jgi:purine-nucleoside phosphorylase
MQHAAVPISMNSDSNATSDLRVCVGAAVDSIRQRCSQRSRVGIILGTGLGNFAVEIENPTALAYDDIPHFPHSTAIGHRGQFTCGAVGGVPVVTMEGRFHVYEGYTPAQITLPVRVMHRLGIELLVISNASGGLNPRLAVGDLVAIDDHINLMCANPLIGPHDDSLGPRFPDLSAIYDAPLIEQVLAIARRHGFTAHRGTYVAVTGPNYETRAEYRFFRRIGGDVIGMSTVPEAIVAAQLGLKVLALSTVTNVCNPDALTETDGASVAAAASSAEWKLRTILLSLLHDLANQPSLTPPAPPRPRAPTPS